MKLVTHAIVAVLCAGTLAGCAGTESDGAPTGASDETLQNSEFSTSVEGAPASFAISLEGLDSVTIDAVAGTDQDLDVIVISSWSHTEPTVSVDSVSDRAWLNLECERSGELDEKGNWVDPCTADIQLTMPAGTGLLVDSLTEVRLTSQGITGDQIFTVGDASTVSVTDAGGRFEVAPAQSVVQGIASVVGTGLRSEQVKVVTSTMLGPTTPGPQVSLNFKTPPASLMVSTANGGNYELEVPRLAPDGTEAQYMLGGSSLDCELDVSITAGDSGGVSAASDGKSYVYLGCNFARMSLDYTS